MVSDFKQLDKFNFVSPTLGCIQIRLQGRGKNAPRKYYVYPDPVAPVKPWKWFGPYDTAKDAEAALNKGDFSLIGRRD